MRIPQPAPRLVPVLELSAIRGCSPREARGTPIFRARLRGGRVEARIYPRRAGRAGGQRAGAGRRADCAAQRSRAGPDPRHTRRRRRRLWRPLRRRVHRRRSRRLRHRPAMCGRPVTGRGTACNIFGSRGDMSKGRRCLRPICPATGNSRRTAGSGSKGAGITRVSAAAHHRRGIRPQGSGRIRPTKVERRRCGAR